MQSVLLRFLNISFLLCLFQVCFAQNKEANHWFFGKNASIRFDKPTPVILQNSALSGRIGSGGSISDKNGNLLFYTDGTKFWNPLHQEIKYPSYQKAGDEIGDILIVPVPENADRYFVFANDLKIVRLYQVQATQQKVSVLSYDTLLTAKKAGFNLSATLHENGKDVWLMLKESQNNLYHCFLITKNGIQKPAILHPLGFFPADVANCVDGGTIKFSPDGKKLAKALHCQRLIEVFDFDNAKGLLKNRILLNIPKNNSPKSVEFSPDVSKLYFSSTSAEMFFQFDLSFKTAKDINLSIQKIMLQNPDNYPVSLQLAQNHQLYIARVGANYLSVVREPNKKADSCGFEEKGIDLGTGICRWQLPMFITNYFYQSKNKIVLNQPFTRPVLFETGKAEIRGIYFLELKDIANYLKENPAIQLYISGHTDNVGDKNANQILSEQRAKAVADYFIAQQIHPERIIFEGYGDTKPIADNATEAGKDLNRRIEFLLMKVDK